MVDYDILNLWRAIVSGPYIVWWNVAVTKFDLLGARNDFSF